MFRQWDCLFPQQIAHGITVTVFLKVFHVSLIDHLSSQAACPGTDVDDIVGSTDNLFIVFHYHYRIAQLLQLAEHVYQFVRIAAMQADARFVKNIQAAHQTTSQRGGEVDSLAFTAGERVAEAVQREVSQTDIQ